MFEKKDYLYHLPKDLIAEEAIHPHHNAKIMVLDRESGTLKNESTFWDLDSLLGPDRVLFFNNSRVIRARVQLKDVSYTTSNGETKILTEGEIFYLKNMGEYSCEALVRPGNKFRIGSVFSIGKYTIQVQAMSDIGRIITVKSGGTISDFFEDHGALPLPPYIEYREEKEEDYQTVFAKKDGSVAAPTASLHFTKELLEKLPQPHDYVTLHVGIGTFRGIDTEDIREYQIHAEQAEVDLHIFSRIYDYHTTGKKIVAVGTTACRTLESLPSLWKNLDTETQLYFDANIREYWNKLSDKRKNDTWISDVSLDTATQTLIFTTSIYITPGFSFLVIHDLITNFHLPESSLIVLVSAFLGYTSTMRSYEEAIKKGYRFYSFGDGMYIRGK